MKLDRNARPIVFKVFVKGKRLRATQDVEDILN